MNTHQLFQHRIASTLAAMNWLRDHIDHVAHTAEAIVARLRSGATLYTCGNGGSAAQALHLAEELIGRYRSNRRAWPAICLNADPTALTCIANDFGFDQVFSRQCDALLKPADVLLVLSTSGNSDNIINALDVAKSRNTLTIGLLGKDGGRARLKCDHSIIINADDTAHIQECHQVIIHLICEALECA